MNQKDEKNHGSLFIASLKGYSSVVKLLFTDSNIDINNQDHNGVTALWAASQKNYPEVVKLLLKPTNPNLKGADPNLSNKDGCSPLWVAASRNSYQCMMPLIEYGADINKKGTPQGATPLFAACQDGSKKAVEILIAANADINLERTADKTTPLMMAAYNGHTIIVEILLKNGADSFKVNSIGLSAITCAATYGNFDLIKILYENMRENKKKVEEKEFLDTGDTVNGLTVLHTAAIGGYMDIIEYLLEICKVDLLKEDFENKTASIHALQHQHNKLAVWLSKLEQIQQKQIVVPL